MRTMITGGAGFIGRHLARQLAQGGEVVALDLLNPQVHRDAEASRRDFPGDLIVGDVSDVAAWDTVGDVDAVVHLAAETGTAQSMYEQHRYQSVNVEGTRVAAEQARVRGVPLVFLSSRAVYGEGRYRLPNGHVHCGANPGGGATPEPSRETDAIVPVSVYGQTKADAEALLASFAETIPVTILRPQNVVGHGQAIHNPYTGVLAAFLARLRAGLPLQVYGDGHETRDFVHVSDVAAMIAWALGRPGGGLVTLNCGSGVRTTLLDLAGYAIAGSPSGGSFETVEVRRAGDIEHACADLSLSKALGAPAPRVSSAAAVRDFISGSWGEEGADPRLWEEALRELSQRGLAR